MRVKINPYLIADGHKNPEYTINGLTADRKGIMSEKGVTSGFKKAIEQGCRSVVIDLDMNMKGEPLRDKKLAKEMYFRHSDFENGIIKECYIIYNGKSVVVNSGCFTDKGKDECKAKIGEILQKIAR